MAYIECDTDKLRENGNQILKLVDNLRVVVDEYYTRIEKMSTVTGEWIGPSADKFISKIISSKKNTMDFCDSLTNYGKYFIDSAEQITVTTRQNSL